MNSIDTNNERKSGLGEYSDLMSLGTPSTPVPFRAQGTSGTSNLSVSSTGTEEAGSRCPVTVDHDKRTLQVSKFATLGKSIRMGALT